VIGLQPTLKVILCPSFLVCLRVDMKAQLQDGAPPGTSATCHTN
jgi:hypothetical protein